MPSATVKTEYVYREKPVYSAVKRVFDFVCALLALIVLSPLFAVVAFFIWKEDHGPAFFCQTRLTKNGKPFKMYKFRSMCIGAEQMLDDLMDQNEMDGPAFKIRKDPRITKIGHFIRRTSIDELPQLLNILGGTMSFVGPRPPLPREVEQYTPYQMQRLDVVGGLTCYWQIGGRSEIMFDEWVALDLKYIMERSMWTDIKLIFLTAKSVLTGQGAF